LSGNESNRSRGLHCFENFSPNQLKNWYAVTRDEVIKTLKICDYTFNSGYTSTACLNSDTLTLTYVNGRIIKKSNITNFSESSYSDFKRKTCSTTREKVFSKLIKYRIKSNPAYISAKKECAKFAGDAIVASLAQYKGTSPTTLSRMFRIEANEYYYAKTTGSVLSMPGPDL
jgi:hypothetical protein